MTFFLQIIVFRPGGLIVSDGAVASGSGGPPNRPLPPTPDDDALDRTLVTKRVSFQTILELA